MNWKLVLLVIIYCVAFAIQMMFCQQDDFSCIIVHISICFLSYSYLILKCGKFSFRSLLLLGLLLRVITIFLFPNLSDDIYRFFWDGKLWLEGIHPFDYTPRVLMDMVVLSAEMQEVFQLLNSKDYYTIYPPVLQFVFWVTVALGKSVVSTAILMKCIYLLADVLVVIGLVKILDHFGKDQKLSMVYFLNPLIITELVGNIHAEVLMIAALVWMCFYLLEEKYWQAGILYAFGILTKLHPFLLGPMLLFYLIKKKKWLHFFVPASILVALGFGLMLYGSKLDNLLDSVDLYFRSFEFNASIYYLGRWLGYLNKGYNMIALVGPLLAFISFVIIIKVSSKLIREPRVELVVSQIPTLYLVYLLFSTTIHPWYLGVLIAFAVFNARWQYLILCWSFLVMLSYSAYDSNPVQEHSIVLFLEYALLLAFAIYGSMNIRSAKPTL